MVSWEHVKWRIMQIFAWLTFESHESDRAGVGASDMSSHNLVGRLLISHKLTASTSQALFFENYSLIRVFECAAYHLAVRTIFFCDLHSVIDLALRENNTKTNSHIINPIHLFHAYRSMFPNQVKNRGSVSYTHLTLPTIYSV